MIICKCCNTVGLILLMCILRIMLQWHDMLMVCCCAVLPEIVDGCVLIHWKISVKSVFSRNKYYILDLKCRLHTFYNGICLCRFHELMEFDEGKRSCRRRLAGHNERRRKPQPDPMAMTPARLLPPFHHGTV